jgi:hypothetical protein
MVYRGLFKDTIAVEKWVDADYLSSKLGNFLIPIVRDGVVGTMQDDRELVCNTPYLDYYA